MRPFKTLVAAVAATLAVAAQAAAPSPYVIDPGQPVAGQSQLDLSQQWWQWILGAPVATNPNLDSDGSFAGVNNNGSVFFLAGSWGGSSTRSISVPEGKPIFFPVLNNVYVFTPDAPPGQPSGTEACNMASEAERVQCALLVINMDPAGALLHAQLDGVDLLTYPSYRQVSNSLFQVDLPADNVVGLPLDGNPYDAVSDGYWVALAPLPTGSHTLSFGGVNGGFSVDVVDALQVPEPAAPFTWLAAGLALWSGLSRRARKRHDGTVAPQLS